MQSCACPAVMEQTHPQLSLSTRHRGAPPGAFPGFFSIVFQTDTFPPPEIPALGLPLLLLVHQGKFCLFAAGHREVAEEIK